MSNDSRPCLAFALLALPLLAAAGCDVGPVENDAPAGPPSGGLSGRPVNGRMLRYIRAPRRDGPSPYVLDTIGAPVAVRLAFTAAAPAQGGPSVSTRLLTVSSIRCASAPSMWERGATRLQPAALDADHVSELLLELADARRCVADVDGLSDDLHPTGPATVRFVSDEPAGRFDGVLTIAGRDRRDREVKLVVEFSTGE